MKIVTVPDPILRKTSQPITTIDKKIRTFIAELGQTLTNSKQPGVGISAIQVGVPKRVFVTHLPKDKSLPMKHWRDDNLELIIYINPTITATSKKVTLGGSQSHPMLEGCLSIPHIWGPVYRYEWVKVNYQTLTSQGKVIDQTKRFNGFAARVIQHENDHLDGILFTDYILNKSPIESFHNLGTANNLYIDQDGDMRPIVDPQALATW